MENTTEKPIEWSIRKVGGSIRIKQIQRKPYKRRNVSESQTTAQTRFGKAVEFANVQMSLPERKALYQTGINQKKRSAYMVAVSDALVAPTVRTIDATGYTGAVGDIISITAVDDFKVVRVHVVITDPDGCVLERGEADNSGYVFRWMYTATVANSTLKGTTISATAFDLPRNESTRVHVLDGNQDINTSPNH
ncbi:hypothetical protein BH10BAC4_BH10BAC4_21860 [soil metagenome]